MWKYVVRRLLQMVPLIIGVSIILYLIIHMVPGNFIEAQYATAHMSAEQLKHLEDIYGINDPVYIGYFKWLSHAIMGDFGISATFKKPVSWVISTFVWNSFRIAFPAFIIEMVVAIPIGIISATKQYSKTDMFFTFLAIIGISLPSFFFGYLLIKFLCVDTNLLPMSGLFTAGSSYTGLAAFWDGLRHMILPVIVLAIAGIGSMMRYTRTSMLEVVRQDYIRTARSKGLSENAVIYKHALRNALLPIITLLGLSLPGLFTGAIIVESIFGIPGIGKIALDAVTSRDYELLMGFSMFVAALTLIGNLFSDVLYAVVDPRVKLK